MSVPILRRNVLLLSSGSLILIHMNVEVCWVERNVSVIRDSLRKSGQSGLWETENYNECFDSHISSNFSTQLTESFLPQPTSASRWTSVNHSEDGSSMFLWKDEKLAYPKDDHQLIPLRYPVFTECGRLLPSTTITNIIALILLYVTILQKCEITKSKEFSQSYVKLIALGIKTGCVLSNIPNIKQFSIKWSCCHN